MKRLTHLGVSGLKNHRRTELAIPQLLALTGPNGAGKSSITQAVTIGILGHDPAIGKKLDATRRLVSPGRDRAVIALSFDDGFAIERSIGRSMEIEVQPAKRENTLDQMQERINEETGSFLLSFDLAAFLALSAEKRRAYLLGTLPRDLVELDEVIFRTRLGYEEAEPVIQRAIDKLWMEDVVANRSLADGLAAAIDHTRSRTNDIEQARRNQVTISAAADAEARTSTMAESDPARLPNLQSELQSVQQQIGELQERRSAADQAETEIRRRQHDRQVLESRLAAAARDVELIQEDLTHPIATDEELAALEEAARHAEVKSRSQRDAVTYAGEQRAARKAELENITTRLQQLEGKTSCPTCGSLSNVSDVRCQLETDMRATLDAIEAAEARYTAALEQQAEYDRAADSARNELAKVRAARQARVQAEGHLSVAKNRHEMVSEQLRTFEMPGATSFTIDDVATLSELGRHAAELRAEIEIEQQKLRAAGKAEAARDRADAELHKLEQATARADALKGLLGSLQKLRAHVIEQLVGPVEATANEILSAIDPAKTFKFLFEREGRDTFDFGFEENGVFRSYDAASTGEDAFLAVVLVASIIAAVKPAWRVLLVDNAESIDADRRSDLMGALAGLRDRFDNVILAGCCDFVAHPAWQIVDVEELTSSRAAVAA